MRKHEDFQQRLFGAIAERQTVPFVYGEFDCCLAAGDLVMAMTDIDLMKPFRGRYKSAASAARILQTDGHGTLLKTLISLMPEYGSKRIPIAAARMGDLVVTKKGLHDQSRGQACGVWMGATGIFPGETGWTHLPISAMCAAFRIG